MSKYTLYLSEADLLKQLVEVVSHSTCDVNLSNGRGTVDAKSMLGVMGLDHSAPLTLEIIGGNGDKKHLLETIKNKLGEEVFMPCT